MRATGATALLVALGVAGLTACGGPDVTAGRLENAIGPAFAQLFQRQQALLGKGAPGQLQASAQCHRSEPSSAESGAADDWVCQLLLQVGGPTASYTYEVNARADGCYTADGPPAVVGGRTLTGPNGGTFINPLFSIDGCYDTS